MDDKYRLVRKHSELWRSLRDGDFEEEEIWDVVKEREDYTCEEVFHHKAKNKELSSLLIPIGSRTIPIPRTSSESSSVNSSAPVNIPNWSKIYGHDDDKVNKSVKNVSRYGNDNYGYYDDHEGGDDHEVLNHGERGSDDDDDGEDEDEDDDDGDGEYGTRLPPHEIIARRLARSQISSFSVFEGVGRTLKGRDLSKVRNSVLIKTGFLESL